MVSWLSWIFSAAVSCLKLPEIWGILPAFLPTCTFLPLAIKQINSHRRNFSLFLRDYFSGKRETRKFLEHQLHLLLQHDWLTDRHYLASQCNIDATGSTNYSVLVFLLLQNTVISADFVFSLWLADWFGPLHAWKLAKITFSAAPLRPIIIFLSRANNRY